MNLRILLFFVGCIPLSLQSQDITKDTITAKEQRAKGNLLTKQAQYEEGKLLLEKAIQLYLSHELWEQVFATRNELSKNRWSSSHEDEALDIAKQNRQDIVEKLGENTVLEVEALNNIGAAYGVKGYNDISLLYLEKALKLRLQVMGESHPSIGKAYHNLGVVLYREGHYQDALEKLHRALEIRHKNYGFDSPKIIGTYQVLGLVHVHRQSYDQALEYFHKAEKLIIATYGEAHPRTADAYQRLAIAYENHGEFKKAFKNYEKAEQIIIDLAGADHPFLSPIYNNWGECYQEFGDYRKALDYLEKAHRIIQINFDEQHEQKVHILSNIGDCYNGMEKYDTALLYYNKSLELYTSIVGDRNPELAEVYNKVGEQYAELGEYEKSLYYFQHAIHANLPNYRDSSIYDCPKFEGIVYYSATYLIETLLQKGKAAHQYFLKSRAAKDLENSHQSLMLAVDILDRAEHDMPHESDKKQLLKSGQDVYRSAIASCLEMYDFHKDAQYLHQAFRVSEKDKSVLLLETIHGKDAQAFGGLPSSIVRKDENLRIDISNYKKKILDAKSIGDTDKVNYYEDKLFDCEAQEEELEEYLKQHYKKYYKLKYKEVLAKVADVQGLLLHKGQMFIEYFVTDTLVYIFSITKEDFKVNRVHFPQINEHINQLRRSLVNFQLVETGAEAQVSHSLFVEASHELYKKLIAPINIPQNISRLAISPDGHLNDLPFEVLLSKLPEQLDHDYKKLDYLLLDYAVSYAYTATLLYEFSRHPITVSNHRILAFAPTYATAAQNLKNRHPHIQNMRQTLEELPGAHREVKALEGLFDGEFLYGEKATESQLTKHTQDHGIIHLAMHGILNRANPRASSLIFSEDGDSAQDNILEVAEINHLKINAELVVLSACETGYGKFQDGEGAMSIARSFMYAGTHSLLMSMWQVSDQATEELMYAFYVNLQAGMPKDLALQKAKIAYLEKSEGLESHPFLWAPFVALGEVGAIEIAQNNRMLYLFSAAAILLLLALFLWFKGRKNNPVSKSEA